MRAQARQSSQEEEEESAFISMTDMTVGFLFIVMILLAFFASQFRQNNLENVPMVKEEIYREEKKLRLSAEQERDTLRLELQRAGAALDKQLAITSAQTTKIIELESEISALKERNTVLDADLARQKESNRTQRLEIARLQQELAALKRRLAELEASMRDPLEAYLAQVAAARQKLLKQLEQGLRADFPLLKVTVNEENGALQFQGEGLFASNRFDLSEDKRQIVRRIAYRLNEVLPCYTIVEEFPVGTECDNPDIAIIEAVQIEGHTDADGTPLGNIVLSANRATTTFGLMIETVPELRNYKNHKGQSVMSFAGYGQDRPIDPSNTKEAYSTNRRIDLRFIMVTPSSTDEIATIRARFSDLSRTTP